MKARGKTASKPGLSIMSRMLQVKIRWRTQDPLASETRREDWRYGLVIKSRLSTSKSRNRKVIGYVPRAVSVTWGTCQDAQLWAEVYKGRRRWQVCTDLQEVCPWWGRWILPKFKGEFFKYYPWLRYNLITTVLNVCCSAYTWQNTEWCLTLLTFSFLLWKVQKRSWKGD